MNVTPECESKLPSKFLAMCTLLIMAFPLFATISPGQPKKKRYEVTWVRGQIKRQSKAGYPAAKVAVTLVPRASKDDDSQAMLVYTGADGMFDFHVPSGAYVLKVRWSEKESKEFLIQVTGQKYFDIAPIVIP